MKNVKTYERLVKKAGLGICETSRMPNLNKVSELLTELGIQNNCFESSCEKWSSANGCRYNTFGGSKTYNGFTLIVPEINMNINSTDTYYSWNTIQYARDLVKLIEEKLK